jgi:TRAP-type C4-dicarboxylate transport system permease small subunit
MLPENKTKTNIGIAVGIILQLIGRGLAATSDSGRILGAILMLVGAVFFIWGCMNYAEGKGHSKWLGLLGLLSCLGLIILVILPDHHKESR